MSTSQTPQSQNRINSDLSLKDLLDLQKKDILLSLNCHAIATIQSFDPAKQTVTATINYKKTFMQADAKGTYAPVLVDYPVLLDCPVMISHGGAGCLTFPIVKGDTCLILFNDRDIDNWYSSGQVGPLATQRLHSFSDGIALIGVRASNNPIANYDTNRVVLKNGSTMVGIGSSHVKISNGTTTLNTLLQNLITTCQNLANATSAITVICSSPGSPSGVPVNAAAIVAISTQLSTLATQIGGLLE